MKTHTYLLLSLYLLAFWSCGKKPLPGNDTSSSSPVFYATCELNGVPLKLEAGSNDYYMNSSYYFDSSGVYVYKAELTQKSCTSGCNYAMSILINDSRVSVSGAAMDVNAGLRAGSYTFKTNDTTPVSYVARFTPAIPMQSGESYKWTFDDGSTQSGFEANRAFSADKKYSVTLDYGNASCSASHSNIFDVGNPLQTTITANKNPNMGSVLNYQFNAFPTGRAPYKYLWDFGDNTSSAAPDPSHTFSKGRFRVKLLLTDADMDTCVSYYQLSLSKDNDCAANYTAIFTPVINKWLSAVTIQVKDMNGTVYSSKDYVQSAGSSFQIVSVEDYKDNDLGQATKKIHIQFNCTLKNGGNTLSLKNGDAVIAVAYK